MRATIRVFVAVAILAAVLALAAAPKPQPPTDKEVQAAKKIGIFTVTMKTSKGTVTMQVDGKSAPLTAANFVKLAQSGFYNGIVFHRIEPGFVAQAGDPTGKGTGGPGYTIKDEKSPLRHETGALGMAKTPQPNSAGSQFYICLDAAPHLNGNYTVFGKVTKGMDVVRKLRVGDRIEKMTVKPVLKG